MNSQQPYAIALLVVIKVILAGALGNNVIVKTGASEYKQVYITKSTLQRKRKNV